MKKLFLLLVLILLGCIKGEVNFLKLKYENGVYLKGNSLFTGRAVEYISKKNPEIKNIIELKNGKIEYKEMYEDNIKNGESVMYYPNGQIKSIGNNINGQIEGEVITYYENGTILSKQNYIGGSVEGEVVTYYPNGKMQSKVQFKNGQPIGNFIFYTETGEMKTLNQNGEEITN